MKKLPLLAAFFLLFLTSLNNLKAQCDASFTTVIDCNCVTFTPTFNDPNCIYSWDFGLPNATSNDLSPTYCYSFTGNDIASANVNLNIECSNGESCDSSMMINFAQIPDAELDPLNAAGWLNCAVNLNNPDFPLIVENLSTTTATNTMYIIEWGDSSLINGVMVPNIDTFDTDFINAIHLYQQFLAYNVTLTVTGQNGCSTSTTYEFINSAADPDIGIELDGTSNECIGYTGTFSITNTEDNPPFTIYIVRVDNGLNESLDTFNHPPPSTFEYTFNTGSCYDTTIVSGQIFPHSFSVSILAITENCGTSIAAAGPIQIDEPPLADFNIDPQLTQCSPSDTFHIINESIPGDYNLVGTNDCSDSTWYYWSIFPDANYTLTQGVLGIYNDFPVLASPGSPEGISLVFDAPGEYEISLVAQSRLGSVCDTSMYTQTICVLPQPIASFIPTISLDCAPSTIGFENTSNTIGSCAGATYNWNVDFIESECGLDSAYQVVDSNPLYPFISFNSSGQYVVQLEVINQCDTAYYEETITIAQASVIAIDSIPDACLSTIITPGFENLTTCYAPVNCRWFVPNALDPSIIDTLIGCDPPSLSYNIVGPYTIGVEVTNDCGTIVDTETFTLFGLPEIPEIITNSPICEGLDLCFEINNLGDNQIIEWNGPQGWNSDLLIDCIENAALIDGGVYQLIITDTLTGCINDTSINIIIIDSPNITIQPENLSICVGDTVSINVSGADTYNWSPGTGLSTTTGSSIEAFPLVTTTYILSSTDNTTGCSTVDSIEVIVNPLPIVEAGVDTFTCTNSDLQLGGIPIGGTWTDQQGEVIINGIFNENNPGVYTLFYSFTDNNSCSNLDSLSVCVIDNPIASFTLDTITACIGNTVSTLNTSTTLNDCEEATYNWSVLFDGAECHSDSTGWAFSTGNANSISPSFAFTLSGVYTIQLEVANSCDTVYSTQTITIGDAPDVQIDSLDLLCETFSIQPSAMIRACNSTIQTYSWSFPGADIPSHDGPIPPIITYPGIGTYTISLTVTNSCGSSTDNYTFDIFTLPEVTASNDSPLCAGEGLQLSSIANTAINFDWQGPDGFESDAPNPVITNIDTSQAGIYYLTVEDANGCTNTDSTEVEILDDPTVTITSSDSNICFGDTTVLIASGADTYNWSPSTGLNTTTGDTVIANALITTTYTVIGTNTTTGCTSQETIEIVVNELPIVTAGDNTFSCVNNDLQLLGSPPDGVWTDEQGNVIIGGLFNPSVADSYLLYYNFTDANGCQNQDSLIACVTNNPIADFQLDTTIACTGTTIQATNTSNTLNNCLSPIYTWSVFFDGGDCNTDSTGWAFVNSNENSIDPNFEFTLSGQYIIQLEIANNCDTVLSNQLVTIGEAPIVEIDSFEIACEVFSFQPQATIIDCNSPAQTFNWSFPGADIPSFEGIQAPIITYPDVGIYTISLTVVSPCGSTTGTYTFEIFNLPEVTAFNNSPLCAGEDLQVNSTAPVGSTFDWSGPNSFSSDQQNPVITNISLNQAGTYSLTVTDLNTCTNTATTNVEILALPNVTINADNAPFCFGDTTTLSLTADSTYTYSWSPSTGLNTTTGDTVLAFPSTTTTYVVTSINGSTGCINLDTFELIVNPLPIVEAGINLQACAGIDLQLGGTPEGGIWRDSLGNIIVDGIYNETNPGTYTLGYTYTDSVDCPNSDFTQVCVQNNPIASFDIDTTIGCQSLQVNLSNTSNTLSDCGLTTYTWDVLFNGAACHEDSTGWEYISGGPNSIDAIIAFNLSGIYTIQLSVENGCGINSFSQEITVGDTPSLIFSDILNLCDEYTIDSVSVEILDCNSPISDISWTIGPDANISTWQGAILPPITFDGLGIKTITLSVTNGCGVISETIDFEIFDLPTAEVSSNAPLCEEEDLQLTLISNGTSFSWTGPNGFTSNLQNPIIPNLELGEEGTYTVIVTDTISGCTNQASVFVEIYSLPLVDIQSSSDLCPRDTIIELEASPAGGVWSGTGVSPDGTFNPGLQGPGTYSLIYTYTDSVTFCIETATTDITVNQLALQELYEDQLCADEFIIKNGTRYDIDNPSGTEFYLNSFNDCDSLIEQINLSFWELDADVFTEMPSCFEENDGAMIVDTIIGGTPPYTLNIAGIPSFVTSTFPVTIPRLNAGSYDLTIVDAQGCTTVEQDIIVDSPDELKLELGADQTIELGDSVQLEALITPGVPDPIIVWNSLETLSGCDSCATPYAKPIRTTKYTATYTDEMGCTATDDIILRVDARKDVFIPNIFTPNGDGINDILFINAGENVENINLFLVYDRWGEVVFEGKNFQPNDPAYGWDGKLKGEEMNPAVFVYWAEVVLINKETVIVKGDVTLMR